MVTQLTHNWWAVALRGVFAIIFGILAFIRPGITLEVLVLFFGAYALMDGIFAMISALRHNRGARQWWLLLEGIVGIVAGMLTFFWPGVTAIALVYLIASWAVITGIFEILSAIELRKTINNEWLLILDGLLSVLFGVLIALYPGMGALTVAWIIGLYAMAFGVLLLGFGFRLRHWANTTPTLPMTTGHPA
ncbi:HdeD family acid-resistance protein [soil metagenome]